tara:strand:- start:178 stop:1047 length:870 start_codon:yes stop_codon:yes gene_type:complete
MFLLLLASLVTSVSAADSGQFDCRFGSGDTTGSISILADGILPPPSAPPSDACDFDCPKVPAEIKAARRWHSDLRISIRDEDGRASQSPRAKQFDGYLRVLAKTASLAYSYVEAKPNVVLQESNFDFMLGMRDGPREDPDELVWYLSRFAHYKHSIAAAEVAARYDVRREPGEALYFSFFTPNDHDRVAGFIVYSQCGDIRFAWCGYPAPIPRILSAVFQVECAYRIMGVPDHVDDNSDPIAGQFARSKQASGSFALSNSRAGLHHVDPQDIRVSDEMRDRIEEIYARR